MTLGTYHVALRKYLPVEFLTFLVSSVQKNKCIEQSMICSRNVFCSCHLVAWLTNQLYAWILFPVWKNLTNLVVSLWMIVGKMPLFRKSYAQQPCYLRHTNT